MKIATKLLTLGLLCFGGQGCRDSYPPPTDNCSGDGLGGAQCTLYGGEHVYKRPSELRNAFIIPDSKQAAAFIAWCYDTSVTDVERVMAHLEASRAARRNDERR